MNSCGRLVAALVTAGVAAAGCSNEGSAPFTSPNASISDGLSVLPFDVDSTGDFSIIVNDYAIAADAMGAEPPPEGADASEARDWIDQLFDGRLELLAPDLFAAPLLTEPEEVENELGWSPYDVAISAEIRRVTSDDVVDPFVVLSGDLEWANDVDLGDGVGSIGEGDDAKPDTEDTTAVRPLGVPIRTGERDGLIAGGRSTDEMRRWMADETASADDDPAVKSAAARLDAVDAYTAQIFGGDFSRASTDGGSATPIEESFDVVAKGLSGEFAELTSTVVYIFEDEAAAGRALDQVEDRWRELDLSEVDGTFDVTMVEQRDDAVVVIGRVEDGPTANQVFGVATASGLFRHT